MESLLAAANSSLRKLSQRRIGVSRFTHPVTSGRLSIAMWLAALLPALVITGCRETDDQPDDIVRSFLEAANSTHCRYLTAPKANLCRRPRVPEPRADRVVIEHVLVDGDRATVRASYDWTGLRRHSTFVLVRSDDDWLVARETPD